MLQPTIIALGKKDTIAYPTIYIFGINSLLLCSVFCIRHTLPYILYLIVYSMLLYVNFTPFHESGHMLIASRPYYYLNGLIGRISSIIYGTSYVGWKFLHTLHHKHTNDDIDPDNFYNNLSEVLVKGPFLDVIYFYNYMKHIHTRPIKEVIESLGTYTLLFSIYGYLIYNHLGGALFYYYILPLRFALLYASVVLDYNAHHKCPRKQDNHIQSTNKISGFFIHDDSPLLLSIFTQNQNYHNIHHLYPYIPFYKYQAVWNNRDIRTHLLQQGTNEINIADNIETDVNEIKETIEHNMKDLTDFKDTIEKELHTFKKKLEQTISL